MIRGETRRFQAKRAGSSSAFLASPMQAPYRPPTCSPAGGTATDACFTSPRPEPGLEASSMNVMATKDAPTRNAKLLAWVEEMVELCKPAAVEWADGSEAEYDRLCQMMVDAGTFIRLNPEKRPELVSGAFAPVRRRSGRGPDVYLRDEQGRCRDRRTTGRRPTEMRATLTGLFDGCMHGQDDVRHSILAWARSAHRSPKSACRSLTAPTSSSTCGS